MIWVHVCVALLFAVLAVVFRLGKGTALIAGYNTASEEEKAQTDEQKLCRFMAKLMLALAACVLIAASSDLLHIRALLWTGHVLLLAAVILGVIYANTGNRFKKQP